MSVSKGYNNSVMFERGKSPKEENKMSAEKIYNQIKEIWGKEGFVPSDEDVKITKKLRAELAATGSTEYNDKVNALLK